MPLPWDSPHLSVYMMVAQMKPGVDRARAKRRPAYCTERLLARPLPAAHNWRRSPSVRPEHPVRLEPAGTVGSEQSTLTLYFDVPLRLLMAMAVFVLAVAAGNVANLLLARGIAQSHETAVSLALGARRWDLLRPRLVESWRSPSPRDRPACCSRSGPARWCRRCSA